MTGGYRGTYMVRRRYESHTFLDVAGLYSRLGWLRTKVIGNPNMIGEDMHDFDPSFLAAP